MALSQYRKQEQCGKVAFVVLKRQRGQQSVRSSGPVSVVSPSTQFCGVILSIVPGS